MQGLVLQPVQMAWRPALSQRITASPTTPPNVIQEPVPLIDSALMAFAFDVAGAAASTILAYGAYTRKNKLSYLFGAMAGILAFKGLADMSQIRTR
jgi:hypothetical protein